MSVRVAPSVLAEQRRLHPRKRRVYDAAKHLTIQEAVTICRLAREAVDDFDAMRDLPSEGNVNSFTATMDKLRKIVRPDTEATT